MFANRKVTPLRSSLGCFLFLFRAYKKAKNPPVEPEGCGVCEPLGGVWGEFANR